MGECDCQLMGREGAGCWEGGSPAAGRVLFRFGVRAGEREEEFKPSGLAASYADAATHGVDAAFDNGESQPGASGFAGSSGVYAVKSVEQMRSSPTPIPLS